MPILKPQTPEKGMETVNSWIANFPSEFITLNVNEVPKVATNIAPQEVYVVSFDSAVKGEIFLNPKRVGWRYIITAENVVLGAAELKIDKQGNLKVSEYNKSQFVENTIKAINLAEKLEEVNQNDYELRLLKAPSLCVIALWLRNSYAGEANDIILVLPPTNTRINPFEAYSADQFVQLVREIAVEKSLFPPIENSQTTDVVNASKRTDSSTLPVVQQIKEIITKKAWFSPNKGNIKIQVTDFINVSKHAKELGCNIPTQIAVLPTNFSRANSTDELIYMNSATTVRKLLRLAGIQESKIEKEGDKYPQLVQESFEWIGPLIFISNSILRQHPTVVSSMFNVLSDYLTHLFKGMRKNTSITLDFILERSSDSVRIHYEGDIESIKKLEELIVEIGSSTDNE